jgi:uncharacterized membrane protein YcjF (UPF0283 family)
MRHVEVMKIPSRENKVGLPEIVLYIAMLLLGLGSAIGAWTFSLLIPLILLAVVYGVLRDVRAIRRLKAQDGPAQSFETLIPLQMPAQARTLASALSADIGQQGGLTVAQGSAGWARPTAHNAERNDA